MIRLRHKQMKELNTEIEIDASAERVWHLLTTFDTFPQWNPFIRRIEGKAELGSRLTVFIQPSGGRIMTFKPVVLKTEPERELRWRGSLVFSGLFDGEHIFLIQRLGENRVRFVHREVFSGLLAPMFWRSIDTDTRRGFNEMNTALKKRAEEG